MNVQMIHELTKGQRIALVFAVVWFSGWSYYFWQGFPTTSQISSDVQILYLEEKKKADEKRDEARKICEAQSGDDILKSSGCIRNFVTEHRREIDENRQWARNTENIRLENLARNQMIVLLKLFVIGLCFPAVVYATINWIVRAPNKGG